MFIYDGTKTRNKTLFCTPRDWRPRQRRRWELWSAWGDTAWPALPFRTTCQSSGVFWTGEGSLFLLPAGQQAHWLGIKVSFLDFVVFPVTKLMGGVCWNYCFCVSRLCPDGIFKSAQTFATRLGLFGASLRPGMLWGRNWFAIYTVKVTVRAYVIKKLLFLRCLLKFCSQTWSDGNHHQLEHFVKILLCSFQGQGHSEG